MKAPKQSERDFQKQVIQLAHLFGFRVAHFRTSMNARGAYQTAVAADGKGFVDLTLAKPGRLLFVELKAEDGRPTEEQVQWLETLRATGQAEVYLWRPSQWNEIQSTLEK